LREVSAEESRRGGVRQPRSFFRLEPRCSHLRSSTTVAHQPPVSAGASLKDATSGFFFKIDWTIFHWTPVPRPWTDTDNAG
jgi:hypothetical protein